MMVKGYMVFAGKEYPIELKETKIPEEWNKKPENYKKPESRLNLDLILRNAEKVALGIHPCACLGILPAHDDYDYSYKSMRTTDNKFNWREIFTNNSQGKLPPGVIEPIAKKLEW